MRNLDIFVIMPFMWNFHLVFRHLIKEPLETRGHSVERSLESNHQHGLRAIIQGIENADMVIADLTKANPNVTYELGIAHTRKKPALLIAQNRDDVRYDLQAYNVVLYSIETDGKSQLTEDILRYVEPEDGKEYLFSNPFSDFERVDQRNFTNIKANGKAREESQDDSFIDLDDGILDAKAGAEDAMSELADIASKIATDISNIDKNTQDRTEEIQRLQTDPDQSRYNSRALTIFRTFASNLNEFSEGIEDNSIRLKKAWTKYDQAMGHVLMISIIENQNDVEDLSDFVNQMAGLQSTGADTMKSLEELRESHSELSGFSKHSDRALHKSVSTLDQLIDEFKLGESVLNRLIDIASEMLKNYSGDLLED